MNDKKKGKKKRYIFPSSNGTHEITLIPQWFMHFLSVCVFLFPFVYVRIANSV